jgi:1-acyl-sn-glycerol-3-phosphate acyltransferase
MAMNVPMLPDSVEKFGNLFTRKVGRTILWVMGWKFEGSFPDDRKCILIVAPHTSNWDFVIGIAVMFAVGFRGRWLGKHTIFRKPFGTYMKWMGGIPVDRTKPGNVVDQVISEIESSESIVLGMSPEGTRKKVERWKTGFYRIARGANIPIVPVTLDYSKKKIRFMASLLPTGDLESDISFLQGLFKGEHAKHPDKY